MASSGAPGRNRPFNRSDLKARERPILFEIDTGVIGLWPSAERPKCVTSVSRRDTRDGRPVAVDEGHRIRSKRSSGRPISSRDPEDAGMSTKKTPSDTTAGDRIIEIARRQRAEREKGYRAQALKLYPKLCARCDREFSGENLRELTVHHKDHNHDNNPTDGSNWELLCLYCRDNEHARYQIADRRCAAASGEESEPLSTHTPFALLRTLLKREP